MKLKEFTYTKPNGDVSKREVIELVSPCEFVEGIDVTGMDKDVYAEFVSALTQLESEYYANRTALYAEFDLKNNYRRFMPSRMTDVKSDYI